MPMRKRAQPSQPQTLLVVGALHYDITVETTRLPRRDEAVPGRHWQPGFSGKGGTQAIAITRAGGRARLVSAVGDDRYGTDLLAHLTSAGVDTRGVASQVGMASGLRLAMGDETGGHVAATVSGANTAIDPASLAQEALWETVVLLVLQNEVPEAVNRAAAEAAHARGVPVLLNAAPARVIAPGLRTLIDVLVVNGAQAEQMGTAPVIDLQTASEAARELAHDYPTVVITAGVHGVAAATANDEFVRLRAEPLGVAAAEDAGDCFIGTLALALAADKVLEDACRKAARAAEAYGV